MLVQQPNNVGVITIESSDFVDQLLSGCHGSIVVKILDFVKYFGLGSLRSKYFRVREFRPSPVFIPSHIISREIRAQQQETVNSIHYKESLVPCVGFSDM